ncbi:hypothetical protein RDI58_013499 [Solanum bulbocastanum]|uniref:Uncharacterized protein n=1 Tax=Solanum bulbocastanum TaxID=147425 RepID=A0AAN8YE23_SOLBU
MQPSSSNYEKPLHAFELVFDKKSVLVEVEENDVDALPLPTKLTLTSFTDIKQQELIVMDIFKQTFTFTIWDQTILDNEGNKLLQQLHEYPIILARRIGGSRYNGRPLSYHHANSLYELWSTQNAHPQNNFPPMKDLHTGFINKIFSIGAKKAFARATNTTTTKLYIQSCMEKEYNTHPPTTLNKNNIHEASKRKQQVEAEEVSEQAESSSLRMKQKLEPPTPEKPN